MNLLADMYRTGAMRLRQWARIGVGRLVGSTTNHDARYKAVMALEEGRLFMRAELTALTGILIQAGIVTREDVCKAIVDEMNNLEGDLAKEWPEHAVMPDGSGYTIKDPQAFAERCRREGWPA